LLFGSCNLIADGNILTYIRLFFKKTKVNMDGFSSNSSAGSIQVGGLRAEVSYDVDNIQFKGIGQPRQEFYD
jgi:hypothetical protein